MIFKDRFRHAHKEVKESSSLVAQQTPFTAVQVVHENTDALSERIFDTVQERMNIISPSPGQEHANTRLRFCPPVTSPPSLQPQMHHL